MAVARKAVESTLKRILRYTAEITLSIVLLVMVCLPLVFVVPMWIQQFGLGTSPSSLLVNPVAWFGTAGAVVITVLLTILSVVLGYATLSKMSAPPGGARAEIVEGERPSSEPSEETSDEISDETVSATKDVGSSAAEDTDVVADEEDEEV
ncbi:MAG: hypothetical protein HXY34_13960 [Candidatus Thorarchaeota archaeon]|nr:hypothetical protein [Candidatus Thorarchaeota archaeon]